MTRAVILALGRYFEGPATYIAEALKQPSARAVAECLLRGNIDLLTDPKTPTTCFWVHGALSHGDDDPFGRSSPRSELLARLPCASGSGAP